MLGSLAAAGMLKCHDWLPAAFRLLALRLAWLVRMESHAAGHAPEVTANVFCLLGGRISSKVAPIGLLVCPHASRGILYCTVSCYSVFLCSSSCSYFELESSGVREEIRYHYRFRGKPRSESFPYRLADGQWHKIALTISASHLLLHVDCNR